MALTVDTRTATEYGVVRTFGQGDFQFSTLGGNTSTRAAITSVRRSAAPTLLDTAGGGYVAVEMVFIQFAGFTFGKSASAYATPWHGYPGNNNSFLLGGHDTVTGVNNIQYTAQFGNGVSGTIGLDDPTVFNRTVVANLTVASTAAPATGAVANAYGGVHAPDIVGNIRVDQAWGLFQISGALHRSQRFLQHPERARRFPLVHGSCSHLDELSEIRSPRNQVGRFGDGCVADQEHPDRCRRRHQDRRELVQG